MQIVWHRGDLRTHDHPALHTALIEGEVLGLVVLDPEVLDATSARRRAWFVANVAALRDRYRALGGTLLVRRGAPWEVVPRVAEAVDASAVRALSSHTPYSLYRDRRTEAVLPQPLRWHPGLYLYEPGSVRKGDGEPYTVYTPFARRARRLPLPEPLPEPEAIAGDLDPLGNDLPEGDLPNETGDVPLPEAGESAALATFERFLATGLDDYHERRDRLDGDGSSQLSPYLTLGALSPRLAAHTAARIGGEGADTWIAELLWRDFMADLLLHHPHTLREPFDPRWQQFPWREDRDRFAHWARGETGVPVVDAAMRQLAATGWISNRARMIVAQFLVKALLLPWQWGEHHLRHQLLDGDTASNVGGWQWAGGLGVDAAPYFRMFNFETQGTKHDPDGSWLKRWAPESSGSAKAVKPMVELKGARGRYLEEGKRVMRGGKGDKGS
jgi:deoxyribodipyrimidine photo-lyase